MAQVDTSVYSNIQPIQLTDPTANYAKMLSIRHMIDQQKSGALDQQIKQQTIDRTTRDNQENDRLEASRVKAAGLWATVGGNPDEFKKQSPALGIDPIHTEAILKPHYENVKRVAEVLNLNGEAANREADLRLKEFNEAKGVLSSIAGLPPEQQQGAFSAEAPRLGKLMRSPIDTATPLTNAALQRAIAHVSTQSNILQAAQVEAQKAAAENHRTDTESKTDANERANDLAPSVLSEANTKASVGEVKYWSGLLGSQRDAASRDTILQKVPESLKGYFSKTFDPTADRAVGLTSEEQTKNNFEINKLKQEMADKGVLRSIEFGKLNQMKREQDRKDAVSDLGIADSTGEMLGKDDIIKKLSADPNVDGILNYLIKPPTFQGKEGAANKVMMAKVLTLAKAMGVNYQPSTFNARNKTALDYAPGGTVGKGLMAGATAVEHIDTLKKVQNALNTMNSNDVTFINNLANRYGIATSNDTAATARALVHTIAPEVTKAVFGGGQTDVGARADMEKALNINFATHAFNSVTDSIEDLVASRAKVAAKGYEDQMGKPLKLPPQLDQLLKKKSGNGADTSIIRARDPQGNLHEAKAGTKLPSGWKQE